MGNGTKSGSMLIALRGLGWLLLGLAVVAGAQPAAAQTPTQAIYGPFSVKLPSPNLFNFADSFNAPPSVTGPYLLRVQLSAPNSLTALSFKLNNVQVLSVADFAGGKTQVDRTITVLAKNAYSLQIAGKTGTVITVTVFATPNLPKPTALTPNPLVITAGASGTLTAALSPTPTAAGTLSVASGNTGVATVPASVNFASGQTLVGIPVTTHAVGNAIITASANGGSASATVNATPAPPTITSLAPASLTLAQGSSGTLTVTISAAQTADTTISLASSASNFASVPHSVTVPAGAVSAPVPVTAVAAGNAQVTASLNSSSASSQITVTPAPPTVVSLVPAVSTVTLEASTTLTLTISAVQSADTVVHLTASPTGIVSIPAQVTVLAGQTTALVQVAALALGQAGITASLNGSSASAVVNVVAPPVAVTALEPATFTMNVGATSSFTVRINAAQTTHTEITLTTDFPSVVQIPASVTVAQGTTSAVFTATGLTTGNAIITASANGTSKSSSVHVSPQPAAIVSLLPNPLPLQQGATGSLTVTINVAQEADTVIALISDAPAVAQVAESVTIAAGAISAPVPVTALAPGTANVTAFVNGTNATTAVTVTLPPPAVTTVVPATLTLPKGTPGTLRVTVSRAPSVATAVALTSNNPAVASVPPEVNIPAGALFADFPVAANSVGQATITASLNGGAANAAVTVTPAELVTLTLSPAPVSAYVGETVPFTATGTMTDGTTEDFTTRVTWTSSNTNVATIASTGVASALAAGQTTITAAFSFIAAQTGQPVTITAATTLTVKQQVALVLSAPTLTLEVAQSTTVTVTSSDSAPSGGLVVTLTGSGSGLATFPPTVTIPASGTSGTFTLTGAATGEVTIMATAANRLAGFLTFTIVPQLAINSVTPTSGPVATVVTLTGAGFDPVPGNNQIVFRGINNTTVPSTALTATPTQITVRVPPLADTGPITLTNSRGTALSPPFTVTREQDFQLVVSPASLSVFQGASSIAQAQLASTGSRQFTGLVTLSVQGLPAGVTASFSPAATISAFQTGAVTFGAAGTAAPGSYQVTVQANITEGGVPFVRSASVNLTVNPSANVTGVKGRFVTPEGQGIAGVIVGISDSPPQTITDAAGNFVLVGLPAGPVTLRFDATPANPLYPIWPYTTTLVANQIVVVADWTINPPPPAERFTPINNATQTQAITDARFPGLEIRLPAGVTITGWDGVPKTRIAVERIMPDKLPVTAPPVPIREAYQLYFGTPMGGVPSAPIPVTLPNVAELEPGEQTEIWFYDGSPMGGSGEWKRAGLGTVSSDGKTVASNPGVGIPRFCGVCGLLSLSCPPAPNPPQAPPAPTCTGGNPVDLFTGQELARTGGLSCSGLTPIQTGLKYNPVDAFNGRAGTFGSFGLGWTNDYDIAFLPFEGPQKRIVMPGGQFINFVDDGSGSYKPVDDPNFAGAVISATNLAANEWQLKLKDGRLWRFKPFPGIPGFIRGGPPTFVTEMVDTAGNALSITRQSNGRITSIGSENRNVAMTYGANGFVSEVRDTADRVTRYTYTPTNRIATITDADNKVTSYTYVDDNEIAPAAACVGTQPTTGERIKSIQYPGQPNPTTNHYGSARRVLRQVGYDGQETKFSYKVTGACVAHTSSPGVKCTVNCPDVDSWDNFNAGWRFHGGRVIGVTVVRQDGSSSSTSFTSRGRPAQSINSQGQPVKAKYDAFNRLTDYTDSIGRTWKYVYDEKGNVTQQVDSLGRVVDMTYDAKWNRVTSVTRYLATGTPVVTQYQFDATTGKPVRLTDPLGNSTVSTYDAKGQLRQVTAPLDRITQFGFNAAGDLISVKDPMQNEATLETDGAGRNVASTDPLGFTTRTTYSGASNILKITDALGQETRFTIDPAGRITDIVNPLNNPVERYAYDANDRLAQNTDALDKFIQYQYDSVGRIASVTDRKGQVSTYTYDVAGRVARIDFADGARLLTYDAVGRVSSVEETGANVSRVSYAYNAGDQLVREEQSAAGVTTTIEHEYDTLSRRIKRTVNGSDVTTYAYDNAGRLTSVNYRNQLTGYTWDAASRLRTKTLPNGVTVDYEYDFNDRITRITYKKTDGSVIEDLGYAYDAAGRRISRTRLGLQSRSDTPFTAIYNAADRMTSITINPNNVPTFTPSTATTYNLTHDGNGNLTQKQNAADPNDRTLYTWDARNRLVEITSPAGQTSTFKYDALNRRVEKTVNGQTVHYAYDGPQAILEIAGSAQPTAILAGLTIDEVIARYSQTGNTYYLQDALLSVIAQTSDTQAVTNFYSYSPYGETQTLGPDGGNAIQFTGRENDQTGLYYYRARYYDPLIKRFVSEDPIGVAGGLNVYGYVGGDPINMIDPTGNASMCYSAGPGCSGAGPGNGSGNGIVKTPPGGGCLVAVWRGGYIVGWEPCQDPTAVPPLPPGDPICPPPTPAPPPSTSTSSSNPIPGGATPSSGGQSPYARCNTDAYNQCRSQAWRVLRHEAVGAALTHTLFEVAEWIALVGAAGGIAGAAAAAPVIGAAGVTTTVVETVSGVANLRLDLRTCDYLHCWHR